VQWTIVSCLRQVGNLEGFREAPPPEDNSRLLALSGYAKVAAGSPDAEDDLRRCAELEFSDPQDDDGEFDFVIRTLCELACRQKHFGQAVDWRRRELARGSASDSQGVSIALVELFALQADYGPLKGWQEDVHRAGEDISKPKLQYALSRLYRRMGDNGRADTAQAAAFAASTTRIQRYDVGEFLSEHEWDDLAESELNAYLKMDARNDGFESSRADANVHLRLAALAIERNDDATAAHEKEQAMLLLRKDPQLTRSDATGRRVPVAASEVWAEIYWRYLRVAVADHNEKEINRRLEQLLELKPTDSDIAIEVVPLLEKRGRRVDADDLFGWAFNDIRKELDAHPGNPEALNGLAWLCAECNRNLRQARSWAEEAAAAEPNNAAILDTEADVNFHLGRFTEAVRLETRASSLQPDDKFMKKQLARFEAAEKQAATGLPIFQAASRFDQ
jgi:tetratricopeptide (TPR) repeat protein